MVIYFHEECRVKSRINWLGRTLWTYQRLVKTKGRGWEDCEGGELTTPELEDTLKPNGNPRDKSFKLLQQVGFHL